MCGSHTQSVMCVPLKAKNTVIGVIQVIDKADGGFSEDDVVLTRLMGSQITAAVRSKAEHEAAIERHRHAVSELAQVQQRARRDSLTSVSLAESVNKLKSMLQFSSLTASVSEKDSLVSLVKNTVSSLLEADAAVLLLRDAATGSFMSLASGIETPGVPVDEGLCGHVAGSKTVLNWSTAASTSPDLHPAESKALGIRAAFVLSIPILDTSDDVMAVLEVRCRPATVCRIIPTRECSSPYWFFVPTRVAGGSWLLVTCVHRS